jgi:hypothetical protein
LSATPCQVSRAPDGPRFHNLGRASLQSRATLQLAFLRPAITDAWRLVPVRYYADGDILPVRCFVWSCGKAVPNCWKEEGLYCARPLVSRAHRGTAARFQTLLCSKHAAGCVYVREGTQIGRKFTAAVASSRPLAQGHPPRGFLCVGISLTETRSRRRWRSRFMRNMRQQPHIRGPAGPAGWGQRVHEWLCIALQQPWGRRYFDCDLAEGGCYSKIMGWRREILFSDMTSRWVAPRTPATDIRVL